MAALGFKQSIGILCREANTTASKAGHHDVGDRLRTECHDCRELTYCKLMPRYCKLQLPLLPDRRPFLAPRLHRAAQPCPS